MTKHVRNGSVIIPGGVSPWPHELRVARLLANVGYKVEFIEASSILKMPDFKINGTPYELKSPCGSSINTIERNLKRANRQCNNIVMDSSRMHTIRDDVILTYLRNKAIRQPTIKSLIFIRKNDNIIVLK